MTVNNTWLSRAIDILKAMGYKPTPNRIHFVYAWIAGENTRARNNPLATTWNMAATDSGQTNFNRVGVKNYSNWGIGLAATVKTLKLAYYKSIRDFLAADKPMSAGRVPLLQAFNTWGTGILPFTIYDKFSPEFKKQLSSTGNSAAPIILLGIGLILLFKKA